MASDSTRMMMMLASPVSRARKMSKGYAFSSMPIPH